MKITSWLYLCQPAGLPVKHFGLEISVWPMFSLEQYFREHLQKVDINGGIARIDLFRSSLN